jgi:PAS domain S-box-containing protein
MPRIQPARAEQAQPAAGPVRHTAEALATALGYALIGAVALLLAGPPGYASPLYPSAGVALAAVLVLGRHAVPGVWLGAFVVNTGLGALRGQSGIGMLALPAFIALGAALQAGVGAALVRRFVSQPLVLNEPGDILRTGLLGAMAACTISPSLATPALLLNGIVGSDAWLSNWVTWWMGDTLGVLIGLPLVLTLIGQPKADWQPRRRTLGLPLLLTLALLGTAMAEFNRIDHQRLQATFERDADRLASQAQERLGAPLYALQALHSTARAKGLLDRATLQQASLWWLNQPIPLQSLGYAERVAQDAVPAFEASARAEGDSAYRVFDRDEGRARATDREVVAVRHIEPLAANAAALGVNSLSVPAARKAILTTRDSGQPTASAGFRLTQSTVDETGVVMYQALYRGAPGDPAARRAQFRGVVFVSLRLEQALAGLASPGQRYLQWCLVDPEPEATRHRLAGPAGCEGVLSQAGTFRATRSIDLGQRKAEIRVSAPSYAVPGTQREASWLLAMTGLAAASMLGALLLTVTGLTRRTELAVQMGTAELRREMDDRAQAEAALRESEARLRGFLDHVPIGVLFLDPQGHVLECNPRLCEMVGRSAQDLRGRSVVELVHADDWARARLMRRSLLERHSDMLRDRLRLRRVSQRSAARGEPASPRAGDMAVRVTASALRDAGGRLLRMVVLLEDITEHLLLEESERARSRAEAASRAKSEFLSRMSHELRTPLNAMIGFSQLLGLDRDPALVPHQRDWSHQIQRAGWHLLEMINETLDLARIESGTVQLNLAPVALAPLANTCRAMLAAAAEQRGIQMELALSAGAEAVMGDATRVKQVLTNLLSNAVKYNRDGGTVRLSTRRVALSGAMQVEIEVSDTGLGMTPEQMASLFQPYNRLGRETSGIEGTGIGLVITQRLTELMGGTVEVTSEPGTGTVFTLRLPAADEAELPVVRYTETTPAPYLQRLVHYVEDNETNVEVMRGIFAQRAQVALEVSMLGLDGLAAIRANRPDLVLLDMQLPDISGIELLRHLKQDETLATIPVVVVSADATSARTQEALAAGALHYVTKPLDVGQFLGIVDAILENADTRWGV